MASKSELIHSNKPPQGPVSADPKTPPPKAAQLAASPELIDEAQPKTTRARTHTWPLFKADHALISPPSGPCPTTPKSATAPAKAADARPDSAKLPKLNLQVMLDQLDRDMADCPYYEVQNFDSYL